VARSTNDFNAAPSRAGRLGLDQAEPSVDEVYVGVYEAGHHNALSEVGERRAAERRRQFALADRRDGAAFHREPLRIHGRAAAREDAFRAEHA